MNIFISCTKTKAAQCCAAKEMYKGELFKHAYKYAQSLNGNIWMDQIGFMVTDVLDGGFLRFTQVGGIDPRMLLGAEVTILTEQPRYGVIACTPPHLLAAGEQDKAVPMHEMLIDTGLLDARSVIPIGTPIVFAQPP